MSNRQKILAKKEIHAQLNMEQRFVVAAAFNLRDLRSFWRVFCFAICERDTAKLKRGQMRERWFLIKRIFWCVFPSRFVKSGINSRDWSSTEIKR